MKEALYKVPDYSLLEKENVANNAKYIYEKQEIEVFFKNFKIYVECKGIFVGTNSVTYVINLSPGTKLSRIKSYKQDLIMRFNAIDIEFEISINGTGYLGMIVIKEKDKPLMLGDLIDNAEVKKSKYKVPIILGKDFNGNICVEDLAELPHLLIAGTTGTGKSTFLSTLIIDILYKFNPDELKLILIDTRATNFLRFNRIPHLYIPVITDSKRTVAVLMYLINQMKARYKSFGGKNVDDIDEYNEISENKIPRIVLIIEDLYDLMLDTNKEVEQYIKILTQMSRASGIHVVISTQRPSTNVITGVIKANIPARMSFYVPSYIDSRTIIDEAGAEKLQINGDIIFSKIGSKKKKRIQTPYVTDKEIKKIVEQINIDVEESDCEVELETADDMLTNEEDFDLFLMDAIEYAMKEGEISASMIQRKFKLGYARAGKIIDQMEAKGIISGYEGSKPRRVLLNNNNTNIIETNKEDINVQEMDNIETDNIDERKNEKSIFNKWWFWALAIIFASIIIKNI
jgi:S-DNA-T family DNA segregation ATPase FtsK/SpoIIIE|nr:MAG TPA: DNA TRANSLOCASE FTSK [Bacteriophage sp.]